MRHEQVVVERMLISMGWEVTAELEDAVVAVADAVATNAFARAAVEAWIRSTGIRHIVTGYGDVGFWEFCVERVGHVLGVEDSVVNESIADAVAAVAEFLNA